MDSLVIDARFNGPPDSANGGYTAGLLAATTEWDAPTTVRLQQPPPLSTPLAVVAHENEVTLERDGETVARARPHSEALGTAWEPVSMEAAADAEQQYRGLRGHPFPTCFVCGPDRPSGDGLRIFAGEVRPETVAGRWHTGPAEDIDLLDAPGAEGLPRMSVPVTWAALDCASAWSCDLEGRPMVLGEMTARIDRLPAPDTTYVVLGRHLRTEGRKTWTASALLDAEGRLLGQAEHLWISFDV